MKSFLAVLILGLIFTGCKGEAEKHKSSLQVAFNSEPKTLDPRLATDLQTANALHIVYEGLMRTDEQGNVIFGIAESVDISPNLKTYTFKLREANWSDGNMLTAKDFEETWKSMLDPLFPAPNAYQLYLIKGAKAYKENRGTLEDVGISSDGDRTLVVELENPTPYFLKMVSSFFYLPVSPQLRENRESSEVISNGPYKLRQWKHHNEIIMEKNPMYWDAEAVTLDQISLVFLDENTSYKMFESGELDRTGSPTSTLPQDAVSPLKEQQQLKIKPAFATHWIRFNVAKAPFDQSKMRKAFNLALDRRGIVDHVTQGNQKPAIGIVPPLSDWHQVFYYKDHDVTAAQTLFQEALTDMNLDKNSLPVITLYYTPSDRDHKIAQALQQQWGNILGLNIGLRALESKTFVQNVQQGDYQMALGSWYADFNDPINFLEIFKYKSNSSNRTGWENQKYIELLDASSQEGNPGQRLDILRQAEHLLMDEMPIAPLFFASFNYLENEHVKGVHLSELGILDFKYARIDD